MVVDVLVNWRAIELNGQMGRRGNTAQINWVICLGFCISGCLCRQRNHLPTTAYP
jgi:hypothetical protein